MHFNDSDSKLGKGRFRDPDSKPWHSDAPPISNSSGKPCLEEGVVHYGPMREKDRAGPSPYATAEE